MKENRNIENKETQNGENCKQYITFTHTFTDEFESREITISAKFRKPQRTEISRLNATGAKNPERASHNLLMEIIAEEDKEKFLSDIENYPGVVLTISGVILKSIGMSLELGK